MHAWLAEATTEEAGKLAKYARTTVGYLQQIAGGYRHRGRAVVEAGLAGRIEVAAARLHRDGLPVLLRTDLCPACKGCQYAKACLNQ